MTPLRNKATAGALPLENKVLTLSLSVPDLRHHLHTVLQWKFLLFFLVYLFSTLLNGQLHRCVSADGVVWRSATQLSPCQSHHQAVNSTVAFGSEPDTSPDIATTMCERHFCSLDVRETLSFTERTH